MAVVVVSPRAWGWTELELFGRLAGWARARGETCHLIRSDTPPGWEGPAPALPAGCAFLADEAGFSVLCCDDPIDAHPAFLRECARQPRCRRILKQQYCAGAYAPEVEARISPWLYTATWPGRLAAWLPTLRATPRSDPRLYFRGGSHAGRAGVLLPLRLRGLLAGAGPPVAYDTYCAELARHRVALALPGHGPHCHREIEAFGIGVPVIAPRFGAHLHDPLIPDHHYLAVRARSRSPDELARAIALRYLEVRDDRALLERIAGNAMDWYDANAAADVCAARTARLAGWCD